MRTCDTEGCDNKHVARGYCSTHYNKLILDPAKRHGKYEIVCEQCGKTYQSSRKNGRFCSLPCRDAAGWSRTRSHLAPDHPVMREIARQKELAAKPIAHAVYFPACRICGELFTTRHWGVCTCGPECAEIKRYNTTSSAKHRRRERVTNAFIEAIGWRTLYNQDPHCYLCNVETDPSDHHTVIARDGRPTYVAGPTHPSLDHVIALANGGEHSPSNARLACMLCNSIKGDRTAPFISSVA